MKISAINNQIRPSFGALVYYQNKRLTRKPPYCKTRLENCGGKNTRIDVLEIKKTAPDEYKMRFDLNSDAFGSKEHTTTFKVQRNRNRDKEDKSIIYQYFSSDDGKMCEEFENQTLRHKIIQRIKYASTHNRMLDEDEEPMCINPTEIADKILDEEKRRRAGITQERIDRIHKAMDELQNDIAYVGTNGKVLFLSGDVEYTLLDE